MERDQVVNKLANTFSQWAAGEPIPPYLKQARIFVLSKENTAYPSFPNIRTIAITSPLLKCFEKIYLKELNKDLIENNIIHEKQRGFQRGKSTLTNIRDAMDIFRTAADKQR